MTLIDFFPKLIDKRVPISALKIPPRVFLNWKKEGVIDIKPDQMVEEKIFNNRKTTRKWAYLDAFETLWLLIVKELRSFNLDLNTIIQLKEYLFNVDQIMQILEQADNDELNEILKKYVSTEMKQSLDLGDGDLKDLMRELPSLDKEYAIFLNRISQLFFSVLILKEMPSIIIYREKDSNEIKFEIFNKEVLSSISKDLFHTCMLEKFSSEIFINIPIINLFTILFEDENFDKFNSDFEFYNYREQKVLALLRNDDYKEITIKKGNDGFLHLESKSKLEYKNDKAKEIRKAIGFQDYDRIELIQRNDKHIIVNRINKEKI